MAAFNGCLGTIKKGAEGSAEEILGVSRWAWSEEAASQRYADNTTNCKTKTNAGPGTETVEFDVNLQDGVTKGKPPLRAGDVIRCEFHIDDTEENYWSGEIVVLQMTDYEVNTETGDLVSVSYTADVNGGLVGNGTLADEEES